MFTACLIFPVQSTAQDLERYTYQSYHMGTQFSVILYAENEYVAKEASDAAFKRIEELNGIMSE